MTVVSIHQPNFFPWLAYFQKIKRSEIFVFLDHVQFQKTGGTWSNRVKMLADGGAKWVTAPIDRSFHGVMPIHAVEFQRDVPWRKNTLDFLVRNYRKAPYFSEVIGPLEPLVLNPENNIARFNTNAIIIIATKLGIGADRYRWSSQISVEGHANEMLISLVRALHGDTYMCGGGASGYQKDELFDGAGITLKYQDFTHPIYQQLHGQPFVPGLSVVDALMHCGWGACRSMLELR